MLAGPEEIAAAVTRLKAGGLVAFPTETVYGLGANALEEQSVRKVFEVKGRPSNNPLIVHVSGPKMARMVVADWPKEAQLLAQEFWPGPLSIVLPKRAEVPGVVTAGGPNVAVRCPDHPTTLALLEAFGAPLVGPSANPSGRVSPTTAEHVRESFREDDVYVLDGGPCRGGIESTVVKLGDRIVLLRPGLVSPEAIQAVVHREVERPTMASPQSTLESPGQLASHYAPVTPTVVCDRAMLDARLAGAHRAVIVTQAPSDARSAHSLVLMPANARDYAAELYGTLRGADNAGAELIVVVRPEVTGSVEERSLWCAILDRLERAGATK